MAIHLGLKAPLITATLVFAFATVGLAQPRLYSTQNVEWQFDSNKTYFLILKNNKNCAKCFSELSEFISAHYKRKNDVLVSVSKVDSSVFARKIETIEVRNLMPEVSTVLFEYKSGINESIFWGNKIDVTPGLLIVKGKKTFFFGYEKLYMGYSINEGIIEEINKLISRAH